jgi:hypothetical protein
MNINSIGVGGLNVRHNESTTVWLLTKNQRAQILVRREPLLPLSIRSKEPLERISVGRGSAGETLGMAAHSATRAHL